MQQNTFFSEKQITEAATQPPQPDDVRAFAFRPAQAA